MSERSNAGEDRRRSPRFTCGGQAKINCLPSDGVILSGTVRDLSLHGCCLEIPQPFDCGVRAEIIVRVNAASFRAVGEVKAIRGPSTAGMEFVHLSAGGRDLLADMVARLARLQAIMNQLRSARREMDAESFRRQLEFGKLQAGILSDQFPFLQTILCAESSEPDQAASEGKDRIAATQTTCDSR
ncbi:MAG TPA: PilZ domain-containing protein [Terriglobales bacterium]|nr:PilZ domain-containing protein [Terriglobales bacterium]